MGTITASDVNKLRKQTGAGMMDCKKALVEAEGDFEKAIDILRKKGQKIAAKRADREATEGVVLARVNNDGSKGALISLNCETDFVAKNENFINLANSILDKAIEEQPADMNALKELSFDGMTLGEKLTEQTGVIGEKIDLAAYEMISASQVAAYIHAGNKLATLVGFSNTLENEVGRDVAMQVAAMNPISINQEDVPEEVIAKELEVGKDLARQEGKPEEMLDKIAQGRLGKFFKENTLLNQQFIKDSKKTVSQYLKESGDSLTVTSFKRVGLGV